MGNPSDEAKTTRRSPFLRELEIEHPMSSPTTRNPLYILLLLVGAVFVVTAFAYAVIPVLEQKAIDQGELPPPSAFRDALRADGWRWLLWEVGVLVVLSIASMVADRLRGLQKPPSGDLISPDKRIDPSP
jgi:hypothetical protein